MQGRHGAARRRHDDLIAAAWHVEAFARMKKLPNLDKVLRREKPRDDGAVIAMLNGLVARGLATVEEVPL